jgi:hypothetical protein
MLQREELQLKTVEWRMEGRFGEWESVEVVL